MLIVRIGGRAAAEAFEDRIRQACQARGRPIDIQRGRMDFGAANFEPEAGKEISRAALGDAVQGTSKRLVARELSELDVNFRPTTVRRAERFGLRGDV